MRAKASFIVRRYEDVEDKVSRRMELLWRLIVETPLATGEELLEEFLETGCTEDKELREAFDWCLEVLLSLGYIVQA